MMELSLVLSLTLLTARVEMVGSSRSLSCSSLPSLDNQLNYFYFGCSCHQNNRLGGEFSLAGFAYNLSQWISDSQLVVDLRDCWSIDIVFDQELLYLPSSGMFRPDIAIREINMENIDQVQLTSHQSPGQTTHQADSLSVNLYDVSRVVVEADVKLDHLTTEDERTSLHIVNSSQPTARDFSLAGFRQENIFFITPNPHHHIRQVSEFQSLLQQIGDWIKTESREMSLWLSVSVFILSIGIGTMMISIIKRHRLALEAVVYGSIGSLKRLKRNSSVVKDSKAPPDITTATEVAFFPRYSVVNKSWRAGKQAKSTESNSKKEKASKPRSQTKTDEKVDTPKLEEVSGQSPAQNLTKPSLYEIISTIKLKALAKAESDSKQEEKKSDPRQTSFYYQGGNVSSASSKYDLTLAKNNSKVKAEVHQPNYVTLKPGKVGEDKKSSSPEPLLSDKEGSERIYSFNTLREKCRKMIANSRLGQSKTKL